MKYIARILIIVLIIPVIFFFVLKVNKLQTFVFAQTAPARGEIELNILEIYQPCGTSDITCVPFPSGAIHPDINNQNSELRVQANGLPPNVDVYLVSCVNDIDGMHCTAGNESINNILETKFVLPMNPLPTSGQKAHEFSVGSVTNRPPPFNPIRVNDQGFLDAIVRSYTPFQTTHRIFGFYEPPSDPTPTPIITQPGSPVYGTDAPTPTPTPVAQGSVNWDPKGRVFDSKSLEPLPNIQVTLLGDTKQIYADRFVTNPIVTDASGEFNFFVKEGLYYLSVQDTASLHDYPVNFNEIETSYEKAYYCDPEIKDTNGNPSKLYYDQFEIPEYNRLMHCDVPMKPIDIAYSAEVSTINYGYFSHPTQNKIIYNGKVSHPYTLITLQGLQTNKKLIQTTADRFGFWQAELFLTQYPITSSGLPDEVEVYYKKVSLVANSTQENDKKKLEFEPILQYVEGYATDDKGNVLPSTNVYIKVNGSKKPIQITRTDETGYFYISRSQTPNNPFSIGFSKTDELSAQYYTAKQYIAHNDDVFIARHVNLLQRNSEKKAQGGYIRNRFEKKQQIDNDIDVNDNNQDIDVNDNNQNVQHNRQSTTPFGLIIVSLMIIGMIGIGVYVMLKKNR